MSGQTTHRVLVTDDDENIRELLTAILSVDPIEVLTAENGPEALEIIEREHPDLVILDYTMPGMTGLQVLSEIRSRLDSLTLPVMLLTSIADRAVRVGGIEAGANDYLPKPFDTSELLARVRRLLQWVDAQRALDQERARQLKRVGLLLEGAALMAGGAGEADLYRKLDGELVARLGIRVGSIFMGERAPDDLRQIYPPGHATPAVEVIDLIAHVLDRWARDKEVHESEAGFLSAISHAAGELWFPIRASGKLLGVAGYSSAVESNPRPTADPGVRPILSALSRLLGLAAENRDLSRREQHRAAQEAEMRSASLAQERVLRDRIPILGMVDTAAVTLPARATGGDYYSYFRYRDGSQGAFVADVVGKGLTAAMHTMVLNTLVREHGPQSAGPVEVLERVNRVLYSSLEWSREDPIPCTAARLGSAEAPLVIECSNAGHEPPMLVTAAGHASFLELPRSFPLGWKNSPRLGTIQIRLDEGDSFLLYSDGVLDVLNAGARATAPASAAALGAWLELEKSPLASLALRRIVERVASGPAAPDDVTLLLVRGGNVLTPAGLSRVESPGQLELYLRSTPAAIAPARQATVEFLTAHGIPSVDAYQISAVLVEIHTNAVSHGYRGQLDQPIRIGLTATGQEATLEVEEFHSGGFRPPQMPAKPGLRDGGGMGLVLAKEVMESVEWIATERISLRVRMRWRAGKSASSRAAAPKP